MNNLNKDFRVSTAAAACSSGVGASCADAVSIAPEMSMVKAVSTAITRFDIFLSIVDIQTFVATGLIPCSVHI